MFCINSGAYTTTTSSGLMVLLVFSNAELKYGPQEICRNLKQKRKGIEICFLLRHSITVTLSAEI